MWKIEGRTGGGRRNKLLAMAISLSWLLAPGDFFSRAINIAGLTKRWRKLIVIDDEATGRGSDDDAGWMRAILIGYRWIAVSFDTIRYDTLIVPSYRSDSDDSLIVRYQPMVRIALRWNRTVSYDTKINVWEQCWTSFEV
jgi:hypothetical protein